MSNEYGKLARNIRRLVIRNEILQRKVFNDTGEVCSYQHVLPMDYATPLCKELHDDKQHQGITKCINEYKRNFYIPGFTETLNYYIINCAICIQTKPARPEQIKPPLQEIMANTGAPEEIMQIDLV